MSEGKAGEFAPYGTVPPGFEATYTGQTDISTVDTSDSYQSYFTDEGGNVIRKYSVWGFSHVKEDDWNDEIRYINHLQEDLGFLSDDVRRIRAQLASLQCCDSGVPVTIDEVLSAIGVGNLPDPAFRPGCWMSMGTRTTQPLQVESMRAIEDVLTGYLDGRTIEATVVAYPHAQGFIRRAYEWLGPVEGLSDLQKLMMQRMLLPFEFFTRRNEDHEEVYCTCFGEEGQGKRIDAQISELVGIPEIYPAYREGHKENLDSISDPEKRNLYFICSRIADCVSELSDCHHGTFRRIEKWVHAIGTLTWDIPTRREHAEGTRLGCLLFGYALGLDRWLQGVPMQFLLLDLGHVDLGFDPKNEILRVYAHLGEKTPMKRWLAACLWYKVTLEPPASLYRWGWRHKALLEAASERGLSVREWMDAALGTGGGI
jgi:hypothetical protein